MVFIQPNKHYIGLNTIRKHVWRDFVYFEKTYHISRVLYWVADPDSDTKKRNERQTKKKLLNNKLILLLAQSEMSESRQNMQNQIMPYFYSLFSLSKK